MNDAQLIKDFIEHGSETAFRSLVERHLPLVSGTARRITRNNALAEEIAQTVFILLARRAHSFNTGTVLPGWLYRTTCFVAARALRSEQRRQRREQEAVAMQPLNNTDSTWENIAPHLDDALGRLGDTDRNALLLRYFEDQPLRKVGSVLGLGEEAAKKRVARALDKLRRILRRRGTDITATALAAGLAQEAANAASAGNVAQITAAALAPAAAGSSLLLADVLAAWHWAKIKMALAVGSILIATALLLFPVMNKGNVLTAPKTNIAIAARSVWAENNPTLAGAATDAMPTSVEVAGRMIPLFPLRINVLDALSDEPVAGAELTHSLMSAIQPQPGGSEQSPPPFRTDSNGMANLPMPKLDGLAFGCEHMIQSFDVLVAARDYAPHSIRWFCSTGSVWNFVTNNYTVRIESGRTLFGTVVDEAGRPLHGVRLGVYAYGGRGISYTTDESGKVISPPELRIEDIGNFSKDTDAPDAFVTDQRGRFQIPHFPSDIKTLSISLLGTDGARRQFCTPQVDWMSESDTAQVRLDDLLTGSAWLVLPNGITLEGLVVDADDQPVIGATVVESSGVKTLSRNETDFSGRFWLSNRPPREIILAASASGHASASMIATIKSGMSPVRIQLPPGQPLRGRVVNEAGDALAGVDVSLPEFDNEGLGLTWSGKTDAEGRFVWSAAPTNAVWLRFQTLEYAPRLVQLPSSTNEHLITLHPGVAATARVTGTVTDATTSLPIKHFTVRIGHDSLRRRPAGTALPITDAQGRFELKTSVSEVMLNDYPLWFLLIEADGYEPSVTRKFKFEEGDQKLSIQLQPCGPIEGIVRTPNDEPATNCQMAALASGEAVWHQSYNNATYRPRDYTLNHSGRLPQADQQGRFNLPKPLNANTLVFLHESGWIACPIPADPRNMEIRLLPWATIEGVALNGQTPLADEEIVIAKLNMNDGGPISPLRTTRTDAAGRFAFEAMTAGDFQVWLAHRKCPGESVRLLQTRVTLSAGETKSVRLGDVGRTVTCKLRPPRTLTAADWPNALAVLHLDVAIPPKPSTYDFVTDASRVAAHQRYYHDSAVLEAMGRARSYAGQIAADGTATFENVPADSYMLEVKLFARRNEQAGNDASTQGEQLGALRVPVTVPAESNDGNQAVALGSFALEAR